MIPKEMIVEQIGVSVEDNELCQAIIKAGMTDKTVSTVIEALEGQAALLIRSALKD